MNVELDASSDGRPTLRGGEFYNPGLTQKPLPRVRVHLHPNPVKVESETTRSRAIDSTPTGWGFFYNLPRVGAKRAKLGPYHHNPFRVESESAESRNA
jgi:hypothetical protein